MADPVLQTKSLDGIYSSSKLHAAKELFDKMGAEFERRYGSKPDLFARSPGRVNLIGEHIDYEGYAVLPMALEIETVVAVGKSRGSDLVVGNLDAARYPEMRFSSDPAQAVDTANHTWGNYFVCGYKGVFEHLEEAGIEAPQPCGLDILIWGNVPAGSGLSSSASYVCAAALAVMGAHGLSLDRAAVAELACKGERHVGTLSGGMDQAISIMGELGVAKLIEFNPVRAKDVVLPAGGTFVIANSLAVSKKAETAAGKYNLRVVECRLASVLLGHALGLPKATALKLKTLQEVENYAAEQGIAGAAALANKVAEHLHEQPYTADELEAFLGQPLAEFFKDSPHSLPSIPAAAALGGFKLKQRATHVYGEAARVHSFRAACKAGEGLEALGRLMNDSHESCSTLYECSAPELEELVALCRREGALGARLTGAGWGGCTVSLVEDGKVDAFIAAVEASYYAKRKVTGDDLRACIFASKPACGGAVVRL